MIKRYLCTLTIGLAILWIASYSLNFASSNTVGSPGNRTGSPGDNNITCRACHLGGAPVFKAELISSNIPPTGYVPGATYTVTLTISESGKNKFGFEVTAENAAKQPKGTFIITNTSQTKAILSKSSVTHTSTGTAGSGGSKTWSFNWTAPAQGTGTITFYGAINATNGNGSDSGDNIYTTSLAVQEDINNGAGEQPAFTEVSLFPNPSGDILQVTPGRISEEKISVVICDLSGKSVKTVVPQLYNEKISIDISDLPAGTYLLMLSNGGNPVVRKFNKI